MLIHACRKRLLTVRTSPNMLKKCIRTDLRLCMNVACSSPWGRVMFVAPLFTLSPPWRWNYISCRAAWCSICVLLICPGKVSECILNRLKQMTVSHIPWKQEPAHFFFFFWSLHERVWQMRRGLRQDLKWTIRVASAGEAVLQTSSLVYLLACQQHEPSGLSGT